jgi:hypothetical protein
MQKPIHPLRVLLKAIVIFAVLNLLFVWFNPPIGKLTAYNFLWPGRMRFPFAPSPEFQSLSYSAPVFDDFEAMFGAHIITGAPKPANEFRILLLGDSSTWGGHVAPEDMLAQQINRIGLSSCDGRKVTAYDLGYPWPSVLRDVLILDHAMQYQPDMVIWLVTLHGFEPKPADGEFLAPHAEQVGELMARYQLDIPKAYSRQFDVTFWDKTIIGQRNRLKSLVLNQIYGVMWTATGIDNYNGLAQERPVFSQDVAADESYFDYHSSEDTPALIRSLMFDVLRVGDQISNGTPLIVVNEPIFIASGQNSELRYNSLFPRWAYDAYRTSLADWTEKSKIPYFDDWNVLPTSEFANDTFHRDPLGEKHFASILAPVIQQIACP